MKKIETTGSFFVLDDKNQIDLSIDQPLGKESYSEEQEDMNVDNLFDLNSDNFHQHHNNQVQIKLENNPSPTEKT